MARGVARCDVNKMISAIGLVLGGALLYWLVRKAVLDAEARFRSLTQARGDETSADSFYRRAHTGGAEGPPNNPPTGSGGAGNQSNPIEFPVGHYFVTGGPILSPP